MVLKLIKVHVKEGHLADYLSAQKIWNRETQKAPGYIQHFCGHDPADANSIHLCFFWRSRLDLERWMANEHDRVAALSGADRFYDRIEVSVLDEALPSGPLRWAETGA